MPDLPQAVIVSLADAVAAAMNDAAEAGALSQFFTARRRYIAVHKLRESDGLSVDVFPGETRMETLSRRDDDFEFTVGVGILKVIGRGGMDDSEITAAVDPLVLLVQEIADLFRGLDYSAFPARFMGVEIDPPDLDELDEKRLFMSFLTMTFKAVRPR